MTREELVASIQKKRTFLCVGLDTDLQRIPSELRDFEDPIFEFNRRVIDATKDACIAYKPNLAFYESQGERGWLALEKTLAYIPDTHFTIADAKRGDIGNTARMYARTFFQHLTFDAVTIAPYMGRDSVEPFLEFDDKWVILLALTSNQGSQDFQFFTDGDQTLYQKVISTSQQWASAERLMFVVGATQDRHLADVRNHAPDHFFLVPGVGAQGGSLSSVYRHAKNEDVSLLVNSSRGIIYAGEGEEDYFGGAGKAASQMADQMSMLLG